jgi:hypothetical protein
MRKSLNEGGGEKPLSLKERLTAWVSSNPKEADKLPEGLFDIFVDAGVIAGEGEGEGK